MRWAYWGILSLLFNLCALITITVVIVTNLCDERGAFHNEYDKSKSPEELVDILEVVYRIAELRGISNQKLEAIRAKKAQERGAFQENLFLIRTYSEAN